MNISKAIPLLLILSTLFISGCDDAETKVILEGRDEEIKKWKEQSIANDISKPYGNLYISATQNYYGDKRYTVVDGEVKIQNGDSHVIIKVEDGAGQVEFDTRYDNIKKEYVNDNLLFSRTFYEMNFNGSKEWYDKRLNKAPQEHQTYENLKSGGPNVLPEYPTLEKEISNIQLTIDDVVRVGSFNDIIGPSKEVQNIDLFRANSFIIPIGVSGESAKVKNPVLSFVNPLNKSFDGEWFEHITLQQISGADFNAPYDITDIVKNGNGNVPLYTEIDGNYDMWIQGGSMGRYIITLHNISHTQLNRTDLMNVYLDDLTGYKRSDFFGSPKADPVHLARVHSSVDLTDDYDEIVVYSGGFVVIKGDEIVLRSIDYD